MALWRVECRLSFFSPDSRETRGFVYLGNPGLWRYSIDLGGQMLRKFGQFAYHPKWSFFGLFSGIGAAPRENTLPTPWGWTRLSETAIRISGEAGKRI